MRMYYVGTNLREGRRDAFGTVVKEKESAICCHRGSRCAVFSGSICILGSYSAHAFSATENFTKSEPTYFSLINIPYKAGLMFGLI